MQRQLPADSDDKPRDECGVFGVFGHPDAPRLCYVGLYALQHRGQESAGIVASQGASFSQHRGMGLVDEVFSDGSLDRVVGPLAIGHNRYSTSGTSTLQNAQPFVAQYSRGPLAIAHNGNLVNAFHIRRQMEAQGQIFMTESDTEVFAGLLGRSLHYHLEGRIIDALKELRGAYSMLCMGKNVLIAVRDPSGFRPLWIGDVDGCTVFASETCAIDAVNGTAIREVEPGEMVIVTESGVESMFLPMQEETSHCVFELLYLARTDSVIFGESVADRRLEFGRRLAQEAPAQADIVVGMPESANVAALGYSQESGIPFQFGIARNQYVGRTFIQPKQSDRDFKVGVKINAIRAILKGQRVVLVDDSLQRGTTLRSSVKKMRAAGATAVHVRIAAPPTQWPCFYGVDTPTRQELMASSHSLEEIRKYIRADSLGYLTTESMLSCVSKPKDYCTACFDGLYPVAFEEQNLNQLSIDFSRDRDR
ncbi:amidophosphoribosyltransferase [Candidatus Poribacteria bacterium]|jgi:amidophosphoribosyltransferase|nr:amidophosphoribosyltransferase [Candidatus Poribacteria bacterium]MBT5533812.1 amidophosphoribosyltransferase [Candidatus Poribacteria bacterium]MBT5709498.1 amidophosphoribosyltransferase [Candidatus Poribacteria bacterium]MBT7807571.1 amidophosphoribosyltransferase [Candidatus Poribacteria bacterium]